MSVYSIYKLSERLSIYKVVNIKDVKLLFYFYLIFLWKVY
jgi:hypothetical protein